MFCFFFIVCVWTFNQSANLAFSSAFFRFFLCSTSFISWFLDVIDWSVWVDSLEIGLFQQTLTDPRNPTPEDLEKMRVPTVGSIDLCPQYVFDQSNLDQVIFRTFNIDNFECIDCCHVGFQLPRRSLCPYIFL